MNNRVLSGCCCRCCCCYLLYHGLSFIFSLLLALTVRFLTKRFIGEYQSLMRKYINLLSLFIYLDRFWILFEFFRHIHMMTTAVAITVAMTNRYLFHTVLSTGLAAVPFKTYSLIFWPLKLLFTIFPDCMVTIKWSDDLSSRVQRSDAT